MSPIVYFIDDSATMREVIKIAFRRESIDVIACASADAAIQQMANTAPEVVITDVIMPEKDGYEVCQYIKQHAQFSRVPVVLMSGVVNRAVAEKAFAVKADELIRKPFQPQDLIARVRHLLQPKAPVARETVAAAAANATAALSSIFQTPAGSSSAQRVAPAASGRPAGGPFAPSPSAPPVAPAAWAIPAVSQRPAAAAQTAAAASPAPFGGSAMPAVATSAPARVTEPGGAVPSPAPTASPASPKPPMPVRPGSNGQAANMPLDVQKMRVEVLRLEGLVRKLQSELEAEREYSRALEEHIKTLQDAE
jgi:CheY-like chemotaxis protein